MERIEVPCRWCREPTPNCGTFVCDDCADVVRRIQNDQKLAATVMASMREDLKQLDPMCCPNCESPSIKPGGLLDVEDVGQLRSWGCGRCGKAFYLEH